MPDENGRFKGITVPSLPWQPNWANQGGHYSPPPERDPDPCADCCPCCHPCGPECPDYTDTEDTDA